ncbi:hypothetical protein OMF39_21410, partial [Bordetella pertussis]
HRARCTHLQTQPGRIQPIDSSQVAGQDGRYLSPQGQPAPATGYFHASSRCLTSAVRVWLTGAWMPARA